MSVQGKKSIIDGFEIALENRTRSASVERWESHTDLRFGVSNEKTRTTSQTKPLKNPTSKLIRGALIDTPIVAASVKAEHFLFHSQALTLVTPDKCLAELDINEATLCNSEPATYQHLSFAESSDEDSLCLPGKSYQHWTEIDIPDFKHSDNCLQILKRKLKISNKGWSVEVKCNDGRAISFKKHILAEDSHSANDSKIKMKNKWNELRKSLLVFFEWNLEELKTFQLRRKEMERNGNGQPEITLEYIKEISSLIGVPFSQFKEFDFVHENSWKSFRNILGGASWSDMCKYFALTAWQRGAFQKCSYYLSESHGSFWKADTCDKHNVYLSKMEEYSFCSTQCKENISPFEILKQKIQKQQNKTLLEFGNSFPNFQKQMKMFNPDWNIIQITADVHRYNRFGKEIRDPKGIPGIWITCFNSLRSGEMRSSSHYVEALESNILEETFTKLIADNKAVSEGFVGDRKTYWQIRSKHNQQLRNFLLSIEHWIAPYVFLFPGHSKSGKLRAEIWKYVDTIGKLCEKTFNDSTTLLLYKLIENFKYFPFGIVDLSIFLQRSLKVSSQVATKVVDFLGTNAKTIEMYLFKRHETILILDAELERYPMDWLPVFQKSKTSVNRMFSLAHIYATLKVTEDFIKSYPRFVEPRSGTFILNPDKSLENVQQRLQGYLSAREWKGVCGRNPTYQEFEDALQKRDVMVIGEGVIGVCPHGWSCQIHYPTWRSYWRYCGHGSGGFMYPDWALAKLLCRSVSILMGCSSAQTKFSAPKVYNSSVIHSYFSAMCPSIVGFLWEITDIECDRVTIDLLERWLPCSNSLQLLPQMPNFDTSTIREKDPSLSSSVFESRLAATQFMTEASMVVYGLPVYTENPNGSKKTT